MKELNIMEATVLTSTNPLTLICSKKEDGSTNLAPICFVSYLSFNPPTAGQSRDIRSLWITFKEMSKTGRRSSPRTRQMGIKRAWGVSRAQKP